MDFNNNEMFQSVCWTLVHSLWQGLLLALLAGLVVLLTQKTSASLRYNLLGILGFVFIIGVGITFYIQLQNNEPVTHQPTASVVSNDASPVLVTFNHPVMQQQQPYTVMDAVAGFLDHNAAYIVALWFLVFAFKIYRLLRGLQQVHYLRHYGLSKVPVYWNSRLEELKRSLQMSGRVRLLESALVKVPSVVGFFKPVILLPVGLLANMPAAEAEAILLHELAHIRRKDYLVNLVQGFGEVVFFFNPGFLWVSSLMKTERENCCDDLAVSVAQSKTGLVKALVYTQQYSWDQNPLALGFGNKKTPLLDRAKRILNNNNQTLNNMEKTFLSVCIVLGLCVAFAFTNGQETTDLMQKISNGTKAASTDTAYPKNNNDDSTQLAVAGDRSKETYIGQHLPDGTYMHYFVKHNGYNQSVYVFKHESTVYQVTGDVRELRVNGEVIPQENWSKYMPVVDELMARYQGKLEFIPGPGSLDEFDAPAPVAPPTPPSPPSPPSLSGTPVPPAPPTPPAPAAPMRYHRYMYDDSLRQKEIEAAQKRLSAEMKKMEEEMRKAETEMERAGKEMSKVDREMRKADLEMKKAEIEMQRADIEMAKADMVMVKAEREMEMARNRAYPYEAINESILEELKEKLGKVESYKLDKNELIVNGKKQSTQLHRQMSKYLKKDITALYYHYKKGKNEKTGMDIGE